MGGRAVGGEAAGADADADARRFSLAPLLRPPAACRRSAPPPLHILPHPLPPAFPSEPALPIPAEPARRVEDVGAVDPDRPRLELRRDVEGEVDVLGPDAGRESVARVVRQLHRFGRRAEAHAHEHRPEDLHLRDGRRGRDVGEQRRREEPAVAGAAPGGLPHGGPLLLAASHQPLDPLQLHRGHDGAHVDGLVERIAEAQRFHPRLSFATSRSATPSCTRMREPAQHTWPWLNQIASTTPSTTLSRSASSKTMKGDFPPSSSESFLPCRRSPCG